MTGFAALTAAQMSGFGVYMLGRPSWVQSTEPWSWSRIWRLYGALLADIDGNCPIGWAALGLFAVLKLGAPNYKKVLPVVIFIASQRSLIEGSGFEKRELVQQPQHCVCLRSCKLPKSAI